MAASNYMTEADTESIWNTSLDTTRFGKIGVRIAEFINFKLYRNATTQCTNTAITPLLEQFSEEVLIDLIASAKINKHVNPWEWIQSQLSTILIEHYIIWKTEFKEMKQVLGSKYHFKFSPKITLPSHGD